MANVLNSPETFRAAFIDGLVRAYPQWVEPIPGASGVRAAGAPFRGRVSILIGGGSGHYPAFAGLVGPGLATGAVVGEVFTSPSSEQVYRCTRALDGGRGVVYSYGNYSGDVMNFDMAAERAADEGIEVRTVLVTDDVASAPAKRSGDRRGIAGDFCVFRVLGAAASRGCTLEETVQIARRANSRTATFGAAFAGCTLPGASTPLFDVAPGLVELGLGIHGEPGVATAEKLDATGLARRMLEPLLQEAPNDAQDVVVVVNGLGATSGEELFVLYAETASSLEASGVRVHDCEVGELVTSLDMAGCSLTLLWLDDDLMALWDQPALSPAYRKVAR